MTQLGDIYFVFGISALLVTVLPILFLFLLRRNQNATPQDNKNEGLDSISQRKTNFRYYAALNVGIILVLLGLMMVPFVGVIKEGHTLFLVVLLLVIQGVVLAYSIKKGDIDWEPTE